MAARLCFGLLICTLPLLAQSGEFGGYVNGPDRKGIPNAIVAVDRLDYQFHMEVKTNKNGFYQFHAIMNGDYTVTVTVDGKVRDRRDVYHVSPGRQDLPLTFILKPEGAGTSEPAPVSQDAPLKKAFDEGKAFFVARQFEQAVGSLKRAAEIDPKQAGVWSLLADSYLGMAHEKPGEQATYYDLGQKAFARAIELAPQDAALYNAYAVSLAALGKSDEAMQHLAKAIELDPSGAGKYYFNLGAMLLSSARSQAAVDAFRHAIEADPNYAEAHYQYGLALAMRAKPGPDGKLVAESGAVEALQKYLELAPAGPNVKTAKDLLALYGK